MFDLKTLKDKIDSALFAEVETAFNELTGQRDAAKNESINGRKSLKAESEKANANLQLALEKLGVVTADELAALPDAKGQADALKQYEVQLKRANRERDEAKTAWSDIQDKVTKSRRDAAISSAVSSQPFLDADLAREFISTRIRQEGEDFMFDVGNNKLVPIKDGAAWVAATKPILMPPAGNGATGSGYQRGNGQGAPVAPVIDHAAIYASRLPQAAQAAAAK